MWPVGLLIVLCWFVAISLSWVIPLLVLGVTFNWMVGP